MQFHLHSGQDYSARDPSQAVPALKNSGGNVAENSHSCTKKPIAAKNKSVAVRTKDLWQKKHC